MLQNIALISKELQGCGGELHTRTPGMKSSKRKMKYFFISLQTHRVGRAEPSCRLWDLTAGSVTRRNELTLDAPGNGGFLEWGIFLRQDKGVKKPSRGPVMLPSGASQVLCQVKTRSCSATGGSSCLHRQLFCKRLFYFTPKSIPHTVFLNNFQQLRLYKLFTSFPVQPSASILNKFGELQNPDPWQWKHRMPQAFLRAVADKAPGLSSLNLCLFWFHCWPSSNPQCF